MSIVRLPFLLRMHQHAGGCRSTAALLVACERKARLCKGTGAGSRRVCAGLQQGLAHAAVAGSVARQPVGHRRGVALQHPDLQARMQIVSAGAVHRSGH